MNYLTAIRRWFARILRALARRVETADTITKPIGKIVTRLQEHADEEAAAAKKETEIAQRLQDRVQARFNEIDESRRRAENIAKLIGA